MQVRLNLVTVSMGPRVKVIQLFSTQTSGNLIASATLAGSSKYQTARNVLPLLE